MKVIYIIIFCIIATASVIVGIMNFSQNETPEISTQEQWRLQQLDESLVITPTYEASLKNVQKIALWLEECASGVETICPEYEDMEFEAQIYRHDDGRFVQKLDKLYFDIKKLDFNGEDKCEELGKYIDRYSNLIQEYPDAPNFEIMMDDYTKGYVTWNTECYLKND